MSSGDEKYIMVGIAGRVVRIGYRFDRMRRVCRDYLVDENEADLEVTVSAEDIAAERARCESDADGCEADGASADGCGASVPEFSDAYVESLAAYRKIADGLIDFGIILMHAAVVAVDGKAYMFLARSGVGKTTHIMNWVKAIPGTVIVNGDKPLIDTGKQLVYGTPWCGKESYNTNMSAGIAGICLLERAEENSIERVAFSDAAGVILQQTLRGDERAMVAKVLRCVAELRGVPCYRLRCNMDEESAVVAYNGMQ